MAYKAWHLALLEDLGYMDTEEGLINRVAYELADSPNDTIDNEEFIAACEKCGVDPYSFTGSDLEKLQKKLNRIT